MKHADQYESMRLFDALCDIKLVLAKNRAWCYREFSNHTLHPAIRKALELYRPDRLHLLVLEWGHRAHSDPSRIAYTQNEAKGEANLQTVTSVGKYLKRHFTYMPDHEIRDIAALYAGHSYEIVRTMPEMLDVLEAAPTSCMNNGNWEDRDWSLHPYNVYDPQYGWGLAYSKMGGKITGRCLVNDTDKTYVRSYNDGQSFSHSNEGIEMWLRENGYTKARDWVGCKIKHIVHGSKIIAPYLDGDNKHASDRGEYLLVCEEGEGDYVCESQGGYAQEYQACTCDDCGNAMDEDESTWIGENDSYRVCDRCCDYEYRFAIGRRGHEYYVHSGDATWVEDTESYYHDDYLDENGIVNCEDDGEYHHRDNCLHLTHRGVWVTMDADCAVYCEGSGEHEHTDDCVQLHDGEYCLIGDATQCSVSLDWYADADGIEWVYDRNGDAVHPDEADTLNESNMTTEGEQA
jgi:hypothetical protein